MSNIATAATHDFDWPAQSPLQPRRIIEIASLRIDADAYRVHVDGDEVPLTWMEFKLLLTLAERPDRVQPRGQLLADVWRVKPSNATRTVDTHVKRLRDKLGPAGGMIQTVRGVGYRFSEGLSVRHVDGLCSGRGSVGRARDADPSEEAIAFPTRKTGSAIELTPLNGAASAAVLARWETRPTF